MAEDRHGLDLVARNLNVAVGTAHNVLRQFEETGEVDPKHPDNLHQKAVLQ